MNENIKGEFTAVTVWRLQQYKLQYPQFFTQSTAVQEKMAASAQLTDPKNANIPDYDYLEINTKPFHIGAFRAEWLKRLKPSDYSYQKEDEDTFDTKFAQELGVNAETMMELKSICK